MILTTADKSMHLYALLRTTITSYDVQKHKYKHKQVAKHTKVLITRRKTII